MSRADIAALGADISVPGAIGRSLRLSGRICSLFEAVRGVLQTPSFAAIEEKRCNFCVSSKHRSRFHPRFLSDQSKASPVTRINVSYSFSRNMTHPLLSRTYFLDKSVAYMLFVVAPLSLAATKDVCLFFVWMKANEKTRTS